MARMWPPGGGCGVGGEQPEALPAPSSPRVLRASSECGAGTPGQGGEGGQGERHAASGQSTAQERHSWTTASNGPWPCRAALVSRAAGGSRRAKKVLSGCRPPNSREIKEGRGREWPVWHRKRGAEGRGPGLRTRTAGDGARWGKGGGEAESVSAALTGAVPFGQAKLKAKLDSQSGRLSASLASNVRFRRSPPRACSGPGVWVC